MIADSANVNGPRHQRSEFGWYGYVRRVSLRSRAFELVVEVDSDITFGDCAQEIRHGLVLLAQRGEMIQQFRRKVPQLRRVAIAGGLCNPGLGGRGAPAAGA